MKEEMDELVARIVQTNNRPT